MTKALFNGSLQGFSGRIGNLIFRQLPNGTTVVTEAPPKMTRKQKKKFKLKRSTSQNAHNSRFQQASVYARQTAKTQPVYADLAAVTPMKTAYNFALSDWWHAPVVHRVEREEGRILVQASDNVMVTKVQVTILGNDDNVLDQGEAVSGEGDWWEFASQAEGKTILVEAWDLPGNRTKSVL